MKEDYIENKLKDKFSNYSPSYDATEMWANIDNALGKEDEGSRKFIWFILIGVLIGMTSLLVWNGNNTEMTSITETSSYKEDAINESGQVLNFSDADTESIVSSQKNDIADSAENIAAKKEVVEASEEVLSRNESLDAASLAISEAKGEEPIMDESKITLTAVENSSVNLPSVDDFSERLSLDILGKLPIIQAMALANVNDIYSIDAPFLLTDSKRYYAKWDVNFNIGGGFVFSDLSSNDATGNALAQLRNDLETDNDSYSTEIGIGFHLSEHWRVGIDIGYNQYYTSSRITSLDVNTVTLEDTLSITHTPNGVTVSTGPRDFISTVSRTHERYNKYQQIYLPVTIAYNNNFNTKWGYSLSAGYAPTLWSSVTGYDQDEDDIAYSLSTDVDQRLRDLISNRIVLSSRINRTLSNRGAIYFGLRAMPDLSGIYQSNFNIQKKNHLIQLNAGVVFPINF